MKHEEIDKAHVWTVRRASDGSLYEEFDPQQLVRTDVNNSLRDLADRLVMAAGRRKIAETRAW
jgi:hypothetical protein